MTKKITLAVLAIVALCSFTTSADPIKIKGVYNNNRYDDHADHWYSTYVGYNTVLGKSIAIVENGIYAMFVDGASITTPVKEPEVNLSDFYEGNPWPGTGTFTDNDKALWANNFNLMYGNSGAVNANGTIITVTSRNGDDVEDSERFAVRKWNAATGDLISEEICPAWDCLQSAGMAKNPKDGKVYGLFYIANKYLPDSLLNDPDFFADEAADSTDSGYAICTIDLDKMEITQITPGLYYHNFITFTINSEGRAFALTSGGTAAVLGDDGRYYNIDGELSGAHLFEFDLNSGCIMADNRTNTGYMSQVKRQATCFSKNDPNKMYWMGYYNSGLGYDEYGNWNPLPDKNWLANGKYDTSLYEVDVTTGEAHRIGNIDDRYMFAYMWIDGEEEFAPVGVRGDVNNDGNVSIDDVTTLIDSLLRGNVQDLNINNADCDNSGHIGIEDVTKLIDHLLSGNW